MTTISKTILAGAALAVALSSAAFAQEAQAPTDQPAASAEAQPPILPRKPAATAGQTDQIRQFGDRREHHERHARNDGHHDDGWFFFGRHGDRDRGHDRDRDCDDRGCARGSQQPAAPGSVAPPANGLFNNGAAPKVQSN